jgi:hypothetical protein
MSKEDFMIKLISKQDAASLLLKYHYLKDKSRGFKSGYNYGLFNNNLVGVCIFTVLPTPELAVGMFGLQRKEQSGLFELSRLCIHPDIQKTEYNITSWFVAKSIKQLRKDTKVRAILSYADSEFHLGKIYQACNFEYYGLTELRSDFWIKKCDGTFIKHSRGKIKNLEGEWRPRSRKHRYLMVFDENLIVRWKQQPYPI